ncbi:psr-1, partial [Symbiodinium sp. CCMP2456]
QLFTELEELARNGNLERPPPPQRAVPRRDASELSVEEFINAYARPGLPVIITGLNITEEEPWSLEFFKGRCT